MIANERAVFFSQSIRRPKTVRKGGTGTPYWTYAQAVLATKLCITTIVIAVVIFTTITITTITITIIITTIMFVHEPSWSNAIQSLTYLRTLKSITYIYHNLAHILTYAKYDATKPSISPKTFVTALGTEWERVFCNDGLLQQSCHGGLQRSRAGESPRGMSGLSHPGV